MRNKKSVTLYTTQACSWCRVAKAYLDDNDIEYTEADVITNLSARRRMVLMTGQHGVPVLEVGGRAMVGWDEDEFRRLYNLRPKR